VKRRKVGGQVGRKPLLTPADQLLLAHVMARNDRANDAAEAIDMVQEMIPISITALVYSLRYTLDYCLAAFSAL
jgi:hypothetical protein